MVLLSNPTVQRRLMLTTGLIVVLWASWSVGDDSSKTSINTVQPSALSRQAQQKTLPAVSAAELQWHTRQESTESVLDVFSVPIATATSYRPSLSFEPTAAIPIPAMTMKYVGRLDTSDGTQVFLSDGKDQVMTVGIGRPIQAGWQLQSIDTKQLLFLHTVSGQEQIMQIGAAQ